MKKPTIPSMVIGAVIKYGSRALMLEYIRNEYGTAARNYASKLLDTGEDIYALSQKEGGYNCEDVQGVSNTLAKHIGDFVLAANVKKFDGFTKRFKFNRKTCGKPTGKEDYNTCYDYITGFKGLKLSPAQLLAIEHAVGGKLSEVCKPKKKGKK